MSSERMKAETEIQDFGDHQYAMRHVAVPYAYLWAQFFSEDRTIVKPLKTAAYRYLELANRILDKPRTGFLADAPAGNQAFLDWLMAHLETFRFLDEDVAEFWQVDQVKFLVK